MAENKLQDALDKINKQFGKGTIMSFGDKTTITENLLSTGSLRLDKALGGGIGRGRIVEIFGPESSGKSTLCLQLIAQAQKEGIKVAYVDAENALDTRYAKDLGVNINDVLISQVSIAEQALEVVDILAQSKEVGLIVVDSVAALVPQSELDGSMEDMTIGLLARTMSKAMRKLTGTLNNNNCTVVFINQIREKISTGFSMGPSETTTGGRALRFFASQRIELRKTTAIKEGNDVIGSNVKIKVVKNKIAVPMKVVEIPLVFGKGFSAGEEVIDLAIEYDLIQKSGAWFTTHDGQRMQGKMGVKLHYQEHPEAYKDLEAKVKKVLYETEDEPVYEVDPVTGEVLE